MAVFENPIPPSTTLPAQPDEVPFPTNGWPTGQPPASLVEALNAVLNQAFPSSESGAQEAANERFGQSLSFVAVHRGRLVVERYGPTSGHDEQLISWSMAKSIAHALVGIASGDGALDVSGAAPIPEWSADGDARSAITIDHLLRMVPGTQFNEDYVDSETSHCIDMLFGSGKGDMGGYVAALPAQGPPNDAFNYSSGTSVLICRILADRYGSGPAFETWMREALLDPLGIEATLTFDDVGTWVGSSFLHATARDFAKFGLLYLRDGMWDGVRLLPEGWVDYARTPQATDDEGSVYGAHWWIRADDHSVFYAAGYETQRILVDPAADLVLVRLGKTPIELADNVDTWLDEIRRMFPRT